MTNPVYRLADKLFPPAPSVEIEGAIKGRFSSRLLKGATPPDKSAYAFNVWMLDFSHYQDGMSLEAAYDEATAAGKRLVLIAKCTEGYGYFDPSFNGFYAEVMRLRSIGKYMIFIAYHFARFDKRADLQIQTIEKALSGKTVDGFMLDCETRDGASNTAITNTIWAISKHFQGYGAKKINIIYSSQYWWASYVNPSTHWQEIAVADAAHWGVPASRVLYMRDWPAWTLWQAGQVHGRLGWKSDLDFGVLSDSVNWFDDNPPPPPDPEPQPNEYAFTVHFINPDKTITGTLK